MDIAKEINALWKAIDSLSRKVSVFYDAKHEESHEGISDNSEAIYDVADSTSENSDAIFDLAEAIGEISNTLTEMEESNG